MRSSKRHDSVGSGQLGDGFTQPNLQLFSYLMTDKKVTKIVDPLAASIESVTQNATVETAKEDAAETKTGCNMQLRCKNCCRVKSKKMWLQMTPLLHND